MSTRTRTIASFFTVAMGATLLGAVVTTQMHPANALARTPEMTTASPAPVGPGGSITLDTFKEIAKRQTAGVVNITTKKTIKHPRVGGGGDDSFGEDLFERFFGPRQAPPESMTERSLGSGFVIDKDGYVLTNRHVVEGATEISVNIDNHDYEAKLVGQDPRTDVALVKIQPRGPLTVMTLGNSDQTEVGEWVMAIGNPFGLGGNSVTVGVVSYKGRALTLGVQNTSVDMIQTDAAINPGNSGGPLLNTRGEVIGINTMIITRGTPQSAGVGFAVPINVAKEILPQLREKGKVIRGWLGVSIQSVTEDMAKSFKMTEAKGALVSDVTPGSPADQAGIKADDVIVAADGRAVQDNGDLTSYIASKAPGTTVSLRIRRNGTEQTVNVKLGTFPEQTASADTDSGRHAELGMTLRNLTPDLAPRLDLPRTARGVLVWNVEGGSAAEDAGLQKGDLIVSVNGTEVADVAAFQAEIAKARPDGVARLRIRRGDQHTFVVLKLK